MKPDLDDVNSGWKLKLNSLLFCLEPFSPIWAQNQLQGCFKQKQTLAKSSKSISGPKL